MNPTESHNHLTEMVKLTHKMANEFYAIEEAYEKAKAAYYQQQDAHGEIYDICYPLNSGACDGTFRDKQTYEIVGWVIGGKWESAGVRELNEFEQEQINRFIRERREYKERNNVR